MARRKGQVGRKNKGGAPEDNNNAELFKTKAERAEVFKEACKHLSEGFSKASFPPCTWETVENMIEKYPVEFDTLKLDVAKRTGFKWWEKVGMGGLTHKGFQSSVWIFNMKNRMGWRDQIDFGAETVNFIIENPSQFADGRAKADYAKRNAEKKNG